MVTATSPNPLLVVVSGPSGVGKDAVLLRMRELARPYYFIVTATTRPPRPNERDGIDYSFLTQLTFDHLIHSGGLLEWARVYNYCYGVPKAQVSTALSQGKHVLVRTDIQGVASIKKLAPEAVFVFLAPPSLEELSQRLRARAVNDPEDLKLRLEIARQEMQAAAMFDYVIVNQPGELDESVSTLDAIIRAESHRAKPRHIAL
ncbi:MAG: guanylate kinase [Dehalococcoidia bacterium]|nr:guanylate kinase [Dehalococcoidia bacterium]